MRKFILSFMLWVGVVWAAWSQEDVTPPEIKTQGTITYFSAGVGDEEADISAFAKDYNLRVITALKAGNYISDAKIEIADLKGEKVLEVIAEGPWLFVKLPAGKYLIEADAMGRVLHQRVAVPAKGQKRVTFYWPDER